MAQEGEITLKAAQHSEEELSLLQLLDEAVSELARALNSLGGTTPATVEVGYMFQLAVGINKTAVGYLLLRKVGMDAASKLLIRPMLEATFSAAASEQTFLFQKAYTEWQDDNKLFVKTDADRQAADKLWADIVKQFRTERPACPLTEKKLRVQDVARIAGMQSSYEVQYRFYCKFTHSALEAIQGHWDNLSTPYDTRTAILCVLKVLELLKTHTTAAVCDLGSFLVRIPK